MKGKIESCVSSLSLNYRLRLTIWSDMNPGTIMVGLISGSAGYTGFHLARRKETELILNRKEKIFDESQRNKLPKFFDK